MFVADVELKDCLLDRQAHNTLCSPRCLENLGWECVQGGGRALLRTKEMPISWKNVRILTGFRKHEGPSRAYAVEATEVVTAATDDGELQREIPKQAPQASRTPSRFVLAEIPLDHLKMGHRMHGTQNSQHTW